MKAKPAKGAAVQIWIALISVIGVIAASIIGNWDKISSSNGTSSVPSRIPYIDRAPYEDWPVTRETFTNDTAWSLGNQSKSENFELETRLVERAYRWESTFARHWETFYWPPYSAAVDFYVAIDAQLLHSDIEEGVAVGLLFGRASGEDYAFLISRNGKYALSYYEDNSESKRTNIYDWTPADVDLNKPTRIAVLVLDQRISIYINSNLVGEYLDDQFKGGKVGITVVGWSKGSVVVDFDNFEYRRKD